jgi:hypothetical protein
VLEAKQESEARALFMRGKVETVVWTERMLAALVSGVKGGKWFHKQWPNSLFAKLGLFTMKEAHAELIASRSR